MHTVTKDIIWTWILIIFDGGMVELDLPIYLFSFFGWEECE